MQSYNKIYYNTKPLPKIEKYFTSHVDIIYVGTYERNM